MRKKKIIGQCKICDRTAPLIRGHIIPEWAYRVGDLQSAHYLTNLTNESLKQPDPPATSPPTEYLFCGDCELHLSQGEDELRRTFFSSNSHKDKTKSIIHLNQLPYFEIDSPKRHLIERAIIGILYKSHFCDKELFQHIHFSIAELDRFKQSLLKDGPKGDIFDFLNLYFLKMYAFNEQLNRISKGALSSHSLRHTVESTVLVFAGIGIIVNHTKTKNKNQPNFTGRICDLEDLGYPFKFPNFEKLKQIKYEDASNLKLWKSILSYELTAPCPCGLSWTEEKKVSDKRRTFGDCCKIKWFSNITFLGFSATFKNIG